MASNNITKVMKYDLSYVDGSGGFADFYEMQHAVWELQRQTREILNKTIQMAFQWDFRVREHKAKTGETLDCLVETGYKTYDGYIYHCLTEEYTDIGGANLNATIRKAWQKFKSARTDIVRGNMSLPSFKSDQPIVMHVSAVKLHNDAQGSRVVLTLFSDKYKKAHGLKGNVEFIVRLHDGTQRAIFNKLTDAPKAKETTYKLGQCQLVYEKKKWFLLLTYSFPPAERTLDPEKILGIDLGVHKAIYAGSYYSHEYKFIEGGEVDSYMAYIEKRRKSLQHQARYCGEGRIGHGTKTRVSLIYDTDDKIAKFRDTINHRYSKALIDFAVKNGFGTIQMEDLSGIKENTGFPKRLQHWTYYDLQMKIENKAKEHGIEVRKVKPNYTSQRCSRCGNIDPANRPTQAEFCCTSCGYKCNADYNASQNISIKDIDKIIEKEIGAKSK